MAPITQETVDGLKDVISKLEARVAQLEERLADNERPQKSVSEQLRMILMGPPGAGTWASMPPESKERINRGARQGNASSEAQGEVLRVPFGKEKFPGAQKYM